MAVIKKKIANDFTQVPNNLARDYGLGYGERGLLTYIYSFSDGYNVSVPSLVTQYDSPTDIQKYLHRLCFAGYAILKREQDPTTKKIKSFYDFSQFPVQEYRKKYLERVKGKPKLGQRKKRGKVLSSELNLLQNQVSDTSEPTSQPTPAEQQQDDNFNDFALFEYKKVYREVYAYFFEGYLFTFDKAHTNALKELSKVVQIQHFRDFLTSAYFHVLSKNAKKTHDNFLPAYLLHIVGSLRTSYLTNREKFKKFSIDKAEVIEKAIKSSIKKIESERITAKERADELNILIQNLDLFKIVAFDMFNIDPNQWFKSLKKKYQVKDEK